MKTFLRCSVLVLWLWLCWFMLLSWALAAPSKPKITRLLTAHGQVNCLHTWQGYDWWCTPGGLWQVKATGTRPKRRKLWHTGHGLPHLHVRALLPRGNRLWIGTERGLAVATWKGSRLRVLRRFGIKRVRAMIWWRKQLWVATFGHGLYAGTARKGFRGWEFSRSERGALSQRNRLTALAVTGGDLYFGTAGAGLGRIRRHQRLPRSRRLRARWLTSRSGLPGGFVFQLRTTPQGLIAATEGGLARIKTQRRPRVTKTWTTALVKKGFLPSILGFDWIPAAGKAGRGTLWLCSVGGRIGSLKDGVVARINATASLHLCRHHRRNLWVGTGQRLARLRTTGPKAKRRLVTVHQSALASRNIASLAWDGATLWIGTFDKGILSYAPSSRRWRRHSEVFHQVNHVVVSPRGAVWVATNRGLYAKRRGKSRFRRQRRGPCDVHTNGLFAGRHRLVVASVSGVAVYSHKRRRWRCYNKRRGLRHQHFFATTIGPKGKIWVGGSDGLVSLDETASRRKRWRFYSTLQRHLPDDWVTTLYRHKGTLWVGTYANGLAQHRPGMAPKGPKDGSKGWQIERQTRKKYVNPNAILATPYGLFAGTMQGLWIRPKGARQGYFMTPKDGLPGLDVTAMVKTPQGLWIATRHGLALLQ